MPESYVSFLNHHNSWELDHLRWEKDKVEYSWHARDNWPVMFEDDIVDTYKKLQRRRSKLINGMSSFWVSTPWVIVISVIGYALFKFVK